MESPLLGSETILDNFCVSLFSKSVGITVNRVVISEEIKAMLYARATLRVLTLL